MRVYVLDLPRFDKACSGNVRHDRHVVYGQCDMEGASVFRVMDDEGAEIDLSTWQVAERLGLYEEVRKAERRWVIGWRGELPS